MRTAQVTTCTYQCEPESSFLRKIICTLPRHCIKPCTHRLLSPCFHYTLTMEFLELLLHHSRQCWLSEWVSAPSNTLYLLHSSNAEISIPAIPPTQYLPYSKLCHPLFCHSELIHEINQTLSLFSVPVNSWLMNNYYLCPAQP